MPTRTGVSLGAAGGVVTCTQASVRRGAIATFGPGGYKNNTAAGEFGAPLTR
ncbi:MAG: hypothetical protein K2Y37_26905 [Pirellulales bacterium]|nr:hypothetical protein [Pirellulales bacterium]